MDLTPQTDVALAPYTTLGVGGPADFLFEVETIAELEAALRFARQTTATPPLVLGGGSNVVLDDEGYRGVVIINRISGREVDDDGTLVTIDCGAGEDFDQLVSDTAAQGLWGLENLSAIPGSVGATPIQNVGAYGVEVADRIAVVTALHRTTGEIKEFTTESCQFAYRDSYFKTEAGLDWIVTSVRFVLSRERTPVLTYPDLQTLSADTVTPEEIRTAVIDIRANKFPDWHQVGTAGSFFKNPIVSKAQLESLLDSYPDIPSYESGDAYKVTLGYILDKICNLKGFTKGPVGLYKQQALVLVAEEAATANDILSFADEIAATVGEKTGIAIEREPVALSAVGKRL